MYYNRNLITAEQHPTNGAEASGVFDLTTQAYSQSIKDWPISDDDFDIAFRIEPDNPVTVTVDRLTLGSVTYTVDWGDGTGVSTQTAQSIGHDYSSGGIYIIKFKKVSGAALCPSYPAHEITAVYANSNYDTSTGKIPFQEKVALEFLAVPFGVFANVTDFSSQFKFCTSLKEFPLVDVSSGTNFSNAWSACWGLKSFPALSFNSATSFQGAWERCYSLQDFPSITNTSSVTNFKYAWYACQSLASFPSIDTSGGTDFERTWSNCGKLTSFPSINTGNGTNFGHTWSTCGRLTTFPSLDFGSGTTFRNAWQLCGELANFPANMFHDPATGNAKTGTLASNAFFKSFENCALTAQSIENILTSLDTNGSTNISLGINGGSNANASTWSTDAIISYKNLINKSWTITQNGTPSISDLEYTISNNGTSFTLRSTGTVNYTVDWGDGSSLETSTSNTLSHTYSNSGTYVVKINNNSGATYRPQFNDSGDEDQIVSVVIAGAGSLTGLDFLVAFKGSANMTSYRQVSDVTSSITSLDFSFDGCSSLTSFPAINTSSVTTCNTTWKGCTNMASFATTDFSSATTVRRAWQNCTSLTSFPAADFSSLTTAVEAWNNCSSLTTYPANQFDTTGTLSSSAFNNAFSQCALTAQSIENILTSLDTNGAQNITLSLNFGTNAGKSTWSTAANTAYNNLITKGWTIAYNS